MRMGSSSKFLVQQENGLVDTLFSWSLEDIFDEHLFQVPKIPTCFESAKTYFPHFVLPLLEETRAELESAMEAISEAPFAKVTGFQECKPYGTSNYDVVVGEWVNRKGSSSGSDSYRTLPGDVVVFANAKPEIVSDLQRVGRCWCLGHVTRISDTDDETSTNCSQFKVRASEGLEAWNEVQNTITVIYLMNITTNRRVWNSLHMSGNLKVINKVLSQDTLDNANCSICYEEMDTDPSIGSSQLNKSQNGAVLACLRRVQCTHEPGLELIKGPPGTGKTSTVSTMLTALLKMRCRTLVCTPTNVAIKEVASRVVKLLNESAANDAFSFPLGDVLLFGNEDRLKIGSEDVEEIYLDYRVKMLGQCFGSLYGWQYCLSTAIDFLENSVDHFSIHQENKRIGENKYTSFLQFARDRFCEMVLPLRNCMVTLCTHIPASCIGVDIIEKFRCLTALLDSFQSLLFCDSVQSNELNRLFNTLELAEDSSKCFNASSVDLFLRRIECISALKALGRSLREVEFPSLKNKYDLQNYCFQNACLIFCTASSSYKLRSVDDMRPFQVLVIDEAAQLKECESTIPLQLPGIRHAILIGDECQLPAMVQSKVSNEAGFGRSLFERLMSLQHSAHLLDIQYRMHPSISYFPNSMFYSGSIQDGDNVKMVNYQKCYLPGAMFGSYSFLNVNDGREEMDDAGRSRRNMAEVFLVLKLLQNVYKGWGGSSQKLSIGVISPYSAQVAAIKKKLPEKYASTDGFTVKVKSVDGFQGGEEDIIIISTVRCNKSGAIGFLSNEQRANVALTRARHCLWILGSATTLMRSESVWQILIHDAKARNCFFDIDEDESLRKVVVDVKKQYDELEDLITGDSVLFRTAKWKVLFSDYFKASFGRLTSSRLKKIVLNMLLRLSGGWRPKKTNVDIHCERSSHILKQFKVEGLYVICSVDISKEVTYRQVLKVWDILRLEDVQKLINRLEGVFATYTDDFLKLCNEKCCEGDLEVPKTWSNSFDVKRHKTIGHDETATGSVASENEETELYVENARVSDSLLLMKFYSLSSGVVKFLLSDNEGKELELPFEVTEEEHEVIMFPRSMFILGRSGTGKTTVLTMKLFHKEQLYHMAIEGLQEDDVVDNILDQEPNAGDIIGEGSAVLKQLFVTVSGKLCHAVRQHVSQLKSFASGGKYSAESSATNIVNIDDMVQFAGIPDSFVQIPLNLFPIVVTFFKFLMMVDGTVGSSYFERFHDARQFIHDKAGSLGSLALQTFIKTREVNYRRFSSTYWPHFNAKLTSKFDSSRVFTEIMSHIKGGLREGWSSDSVISRLDYVSLSDSRTSSLDGQQREMIYQIYEDYEKMKLKRNDFDMADFVIDLHRRLKSGKYKGELMNYVYIDEVQDLTMRQIAIFKHVCKNVDEGFVFSGDTAQTIARGIDFRFEDIRSLFYNEFVCDARKVKGEMSKIHHLSQNFRTHAGVLKLAQSVIDLLYHFFPLSVDKLSKETSRIYGEAPVLLEAGSNENAIMTIFGNKAGGHLVGFGAQQVILVRDDDAKQEVYAYVGKQALVLTIIECKGLEFQDVLLYNFFGSSPLGNKWRAVYDYMEEQSLLFQTVPQSFYKFDLLKHNIMCSELKLLYVAITRTKQRLWICENAQECSEPMFVYWKKKGLVQVRKLDEELAQAMQVASNPEEWKIQGYKLLREGNYEMASVCFERAGDDFGENLAKAAGLKASADVMQSSNPEEASIARRQAANIFESIGKFDYAAECFYMLKDYEKAGELYLLCGESAKVKSGECFCLAGSFKRAAQVYFDGSHFSRCLSSCTEGKLFEEGFHYIQLWQQGVKASVNRSAELVKMENQFLERAALHYYHLKDRTAMMIHVKALDSLASMRIFLRSLRCFDELLSLELEHGNFLEAANIAQQKGEFILEADLLGKGKRFADASMLILLYVLAKSLWSTGSNGWPIKQFAQKESLLEKAKSLAENESEQYFCFVSAQAEILLNQHSSLSFSQQYLSDSQKQKSVIGEILSARTILDAPQNSVSVEIFVHCWDLWKDYALDMYKYLEDVVREGIVDLTGYGEICCNYFGVRRCFHNGNPVYVLVNSEAEWIKEMKKSSTFLCRKGELTCTDVKQFVSFATHYWCSELLSVGIAVLVKLEAFCSSKNSLPSLQVIELLIGIHDIAMFLWKSQFLGHKPSDRNALEKHIKLSTSNFFGCLFPLGWEESSTNEELISFRRTEACRNMVREYVMPHLSFNRLSYGQLGRVAVMILGSAAKTCHGSGVVTMGQLTEILAWKSLMSHLLENEREIPNKDLENEQEIPNKDLGFLIHGALFNAYNVNWRRVGEYISPTCFLYLLERQLILVSAVKGLFMTTKSAFVEWLINQEGRDGNYSNISYTSEIIPESVYFIAQTSQQLLHNKKDTMDWIIASRVMSVQHSYRVVVLRLVAIVCLLYTNFGVGCDLISDLLSCWHVTEQLPTAMCDMLRGVSNEHFPTYENMKAVTESFMLLDNPLVIVNLGGNFPELCCQSAVFVDMTSSSRSIDDVLGLFHRNIEALKKDRTEDAESKGGNDGLNHQSTVASPLARLWDTFQVLLSRSAVEGENGDVQINAAIAQIEIEKAIRLLTDIMDQDPHDEKSKSLMTDDAASTLDELKQLHDMLDMSDIDSSIIGDLVKRLHSRRAMVDQLMNIVDLQQEEDAETPVDKKIITGSEEEKDNDTTCDAVESPNPDEGRIDDDEEGKYNNTICDAKESPNPDDEDAEESPNPDGIDDDDDDDDNEDEDDELKTGSRSGNAAGGGKGKKKKKSGKKNKKGKGGRKR